MKYQIEGMTADNRSFSRMINVDRAETDEQVVSRFVREWTAAGDPPPVSVHITQRWSVDE